MNEYIKYICCGVYNPKYSTKEHKAYIQTKKWKCIRKEVLKRDGGKCVVCGSKSKLEIHHITYENWKNENLDELVTLCKTCHNAVHDIYSRDGNCIEVLYFDRDHFVNMRFSNSCVFHSEITEEFKNSCNNGYGRIPKLCVDIMKSSPSNEDLFMIGVVGMIYTYSYKYKRLSISSINRHIQISIKEFKRVVSKVGCKYGLELYTHINQSNGRKMYYVALSNQTLDNQN